MPKVLGIAGFSDTGKTTLIEALIRDFRARGLSVATIKHAHHPVAEPCGKDTARHRAAGAFGSLAVTQGRMQLSLDAEEPGSPAALARRFFPEADLVLVEGFKTGAHPKAYLLRDGEDAPPDGVRNVVALVHAAAPPRAGMSEAPRRFSRDDPAGLSEFLLARALDLPAPGAAVFVDGAPLPMKGFVREMVGNVCRGLVAALKLPRGETSFRRLEIVVDRANPPTAGEGNPL